MANFYNDNDDIEQVEVESAKRLIKRFSKPVFQRRYWVKLLAILNFITSGILILSVVGIVLAWMPIWAGICFWQSANAYEKAHWLGSAQAFEQSQDKLKTAFTLYALFSLIWILISVAGVIVEELIVV